MKNVTTAASNAVIERMASMMVTEWNGIVENDLVKVSRQRGDFKFKYARVKDNEVTEISVFGPVGDTHGQWRTFFPDRVTKKVIVKRRRRQEV